MSWAAFMRGRLVRLYPLMLAGLAAGAAYVMLQSLVKPQHAMPLPVFLLNLLFGLLLFPNYVNRIGGSLNAVSWSLFFELLMNALYRLLGKHITDRRLWLIICFFAAALAGLTFLSDWKGGAESEPRLFQIPRAIDFFLMGSVRAGFGFFLGVGLLRWFASRGFPASWTGHPLFAGLVLVMIFSAPDEWPEVYNLVMAALVFPVIIVAAAAYKPVGATARLSKFSGWISFPLYAIHIPTGMLVVGVMTHFQIYDRLPHFVRGSAVLAAVVVIAYVLARFYDKPVRKFLSRKAA